MTVLQKNVVKMNNGEKNVYATIKAFLERKGQNSANTSNTYERHITHFFRYMRNKELNQLTESDLIFTKTEIEEYQVELKKQYKSATVNNTIASLKSLYSRLEDDFDVKKKWFDVENYKQTDEESYDVLEHDEIQKIIKLVAPTRKGKTKALLIKVAYATAFRKNALLKLEWSNIKWNENGYWTIDVYDKGDKYDIKKISQELYEELMELKAESINTTDKHIFKLDKKSINKMMNDIRKFIDFGDRRIVFHSFKKGSVNTVGVQTNWNPVLMQKQGNHKKIETTFKYVRKANLNDMPFIDVNYKVDISELESVSHSTLLNIIRQADMETKTKLNKILKEINK